LKNVYFFVDEKGGNPVRQFIETLADKEQAKITAYVSELKIQGHNLRRSLADYLGDGIYELRPKDNRVFYFFFLKDNVILLHAIRKKTNKIPKEDLALCLRRKAEVVSLRSLSEWS
jgi:phage-related protein